MAKSKVSPLPSDHDWETEDDLRTIRRARDVMHDERRMKRVNNLIDNEKAAFDVLQKGLRGREKT